jgi:Tol biopolymer transport system component
MHFKKLIFCLFILVLLPTASYSYNYPELEWKTAETKHFVIHFHEGAEWTARKVAAIADDVYDEVTTRYNFPIKQKTHVVVRDMDDIANGFAVYNLNWVTIWATNSTLMLRGRHDWVRGTFIHEFSHVVSLKASAGGGDLVEGIYLGALEDEDTDKNADMGISVFIPSNPTPRWWAEGTAQETTAVTGYDEWDTTQDMVLRASLLEDNYLNFHQLHNITVRKYFDPELIYNQSFSILEYLRHHHREDANIRLARNQGEKWHLDFDANLPEMLGFSTEELYLRWLNQMISKYKAQVASIKRQRFEGKKIDILNEEALAKIKDPKRRKYKDGLWNFYPRISPDGRWFSYVSRSTLRLIYLDTPFDFSNIAGSLSLDKRKDNLEETTPRKSYSYGPDDSQGSSSKKDDLQQLKLSFTARTYAWSPNSKKIVFSKRQTDVFGAHNQYDLYLVDLSNISKLRSAYLKKHALAKNNEEREGVDDWYQKEIGSIETEPRRLTQGLRATHPAWSPDGSFILTSANKDGQRRLVKLTEHGKVLGDLFEAKPGDQCLDAQFSPDGNRIAFYMHRNQDGGIWIFNRKTKALTKLTPGGYDFRDPWWSKDGRRLFLSSDRTGIFQIYELDLSSQKLTQRTNLETGAFQPSLQRKDQELLYSRFSSYGFKLYHLPLSQAYSYTRPLGKTKAPALEPDYPPLKAEPYTLSVRPPRFFPTFIYEDRQAKGGLALQISDYLEKHHLMATALFGQDQDYTISYLNRMWYPDFEIDYNRYVRNIKTTVFISDGDALNDEPRGVIRYDIQFVSAGFEQKFDPDEVFEGLHGVSLTYNYRNVGTRLGFPTILDSNNPNSFGTNFNQIINHDVTLRWRYKYFLDFAAADQDINPRHGRQFTVQYSYIWTDLFVPDNSLNPPTGSYTHHDVQASYVEYLAIPWTEKHTLELSFVGGYKSKRVNHSDRYFAGGRLNYRAFGDISSNSTFYGYEDFSIFGETLLILSLNYRFPIITEIDKKAWVFYLDSLYGGLFAEAGNAWDFGEFKNCSQVRAGQLTDCGDGTVLLQNIGAELRFKTYLFNDFNSWRSIFRVAYGLQDDAKHGFSDSDLPIRFYIGLGTDF